MGPGAFAGLAGRLEPADLAGVVISHLHPDHFVDLVALRHYLRYEFDPPRRLRVIAPAGLAGRLDGVTGEVGFTAGTLEIEDRVEGHLQVGPFDIESRRVTHTENSFGTRVTLAAAPSGPALVYSGDCGRAADLAPLIHPGDVLLSEVAFGSGPIPVPDLHLDGAAVGRLAAETRVARVLLTHLQMKRDPAATIAAVRAEYSGPVSLVSDGERIEIES
jgi:ribonuclease BN (tRNA processing enzyme)